MLDTSTLISPPLAGRTEELGQVDRLRQLGKTCGVVIEGLAGVGKSRLAREAVGVAAEQGAFVEWIHATRAAAAIPMAAAVNLLDGIDAQTPLGILRTCSQALRDRARSRAIVLGVDDAHLLDPQSASLVLHLAATSTAFVVATVRAPEQCPDAVVSLWKDLGATRLELSALDEDKTCELVEASLGGPIDQTMRRWVFEHSQGNVLYLREMLLGAAADGALAEVDGLWRLSRRPRPSRPLIELVTERMAGLDASERRVLDLLALGEPLLANEAVGLAGAGPLAAAEASGVVTVRGHQVSLAHPLYGEVVAAQMPAARAREVRLELAETVAARTPRIPDDVLRVARLLLDAGEPVPTETLLEAARTSILDGDPDFGGELAERALAVGQDHQASLVLARAHIVRKRYGEAETVLAAAEAGLPSPDAALEHLEQRVPMLFWALKRPNDAVALLDRAEAWWPDTSWAQGLSPLRVHLTALTKGWAAAVAAAEPVLANPELDAETRRRLDAVHTPNLFYSGRAREAIEYSRQIRPAVPLRDQTDSLAFIACALMDLQAGFDWNDLEVWVTEALSAGVRADDHEAVGLAALSLGYLRLQQGRYREAKRWLGEAELRLERRDVFGALALACSAGVAVALATDDKNAALAALERCREELGDEPPLPNQTAWAALAEAWAARATGDAATSRRVLLAAAERTAEPIYSALLYHEALRMGEPAGSVVKPLRERLAETDAPLVVGYADRAAALAAGSGERLLACANTFEAIGAIRYAGECSAEAAEAFANAGRHDFARRAALRGRELHEHGAADGDPPAIEGADGVLIGLTDRETEIIDLAKGGLSNGEIAERLVLSVRTIESHMYHAMSKLGISDRRELGQPPLV